MKKHKFNKSGSALLIALVIFMVVTMLGLALILVSKSLYNTVDKNRNVEQCKEMAVGISKEIQKQIETAPLNQLQNSESFQTVINGSTNPENELWLFLRCNIFQTSWPYYNEDERGHTLQYARKEFSLNSEGIPTDSSSLEKLLDDTTIEMYWESEDSADSELGTDLIIQVTCRKNGETSTITNVFSLSVDQFTGEGTFEKDSVDQTLKKWYIKPALVRIDSDSGNAKQNWHFEFVERR